MQRSVSRLILNVYIAVSFRDEALLDVQLPPPVDRGEVGGGVHTTINYQSTMVLSRDCFYNAHVGNHKTTCKPPAPHGLML